MWRRGRIGAIGAIVALGAVLALMVWTSPRGLPEPVRSDFRMEFVSDAEGFRFWPRSGPVQEGVAYRFDTGHCGLGHLLDFDGSFWDPVNPAAGEEPVFFYNQDVGTIRLVGPDEARYTSSSGDEVRLVRVDGPVVTQPCA